MSRQNTAIKISSLDLERLEAILDSLPADSFPEADLLAAELDRAEVLDELTLVYPKDIDGTAGKISVLAPVGSALLGLSIDQEIEWPAPGGGTIRVRIIDILYQPERSGDFHR